MNIKATLEERISAALAAAGAPADSPALVAVSTRPEADYQANGVMAAAKKVKTNPRQLAEQVVAQLDLSDLAESVTVAGPGFINVVLSADFLAGRAGTMLADAQLDAAQTPQPKTVVVDYSSPNLAKEMHVGHLRSTIIGDAIARTLAFQGHRVIRQNHVGDWGTQFGMLLAYLDEQRHPAADQSVHLNDLEAFYREAKKRFDEDPDFADESRRMVVALQSGQDRAGTLWRMFRDESLAHAEQVYDRLGVSLTRDDVRGESAYNDLLGEVVARLDQRGMLTESEGAQCVFLDEFTGKDGEPLPVIVQKTGGGYLYATTDLAAMWFRAGRGQADGAVDWRAERILYVTDSRQALHFRQVFAVARRAELVSEEVSLEHVPFGMMLGENRRPFATRTGGTVKLMDLLDEAVSRADALIAEKNPDLPDDERAGIAKAVGIGAVKYADLSQNRASDYVFSWPKMLSLEGNTAPYMQYAYTRVASIARKGGLDVDAAAAADPIALAEPAERVLALTCSRFAEALDIVAAEGTPHVLCGYLYELAGAFMGFYEACPVLQADEPTRTQRFRLCQLTARIIRMGLDLLGIDTVERM